MNATGFLKSGHFPSLVSAFLYFDVSFMVWVLMGPLAVMIMNDVEMNPVQKANLVALPILGGSILRLLLGWLADYMGAKKTGQLGLIFTMVPLIIAWRFADSLTELYAVGLLLGVAGASFAAALPLASRWYPPQYQGLAMGIAGAGNSGTIVATLFANRIASYYGSWHVVFGFALIPVVVTFILFSVLAKDSPNQPPRKTVADYASLLAKKDTWMFCMLYAVTFGGFVGLASYLTIFFNAQFGLSAVKAADFTTLCVIAGSFFRPIGGWLADKFGGLRMLTFLFTGAALMLAGISSLPGLTVTAVLLFLTMMCLGMGNGSIFQLVPQRFRNEIGIATGVVGAAGGFGGYALSKMFGTMKFVTGSYALGFLFFCGIAVLCIGIIFLMQAQWKRSWISETGKAKAFLYK